jgi:hypothetical protein
VRLNENPALPMGAESPFLRLFVQMVQQHLGQTNRKVNQLASGASAGIDNALSAVPTTGTYAPGDFVKNSAPVELGTVGGKYVIEGWLCVVGGTPGTFVQKRFLTGN